VKSLGLFVGISSFVIRVVYLPFSHTLLTRDPIEESRAPNTIIRTQSHHTLAYIPHP